MDRLNAILARMTPEQKADCGLSDVLARQLATEIDMSQDPDSLIPDDRKFFPPKGKPSLAELSEEATKARLELQRMKDRREMAERFVSIMVAQRQDVGAELIVRFAYELADELHLQGKILPKS